MSENRGSGQPQRYCRNCGAELRAGTAFCTSCGEPLGSADQNTGNSGRTYSRTGRSLGSSLPGVVRSIADGCKSIAEDPRVAWVLVSACAILGLLVLLRSAARPILQLLGPSVFLFPLLAIAAATLLLTAGVGNTGHTRTMKSVVAVAAVFYFSVGLFRAVLEIVPSSAARNVVGITLLAFAVLGALLIAESRGPRNTVQPGGVARRIAANCGRWVDGWSTGWKLLFLGGAGLILLVVLSAYAFVLSATVAAATVLAAAVRAGRRKPLKPAGYAVLGSVVLTLTFGVVSDAVYGTGAGIEITTNSRSEEYHNERRVQQGSAATYEDEVAPGLEEIARRWSLSNIESPLFVPSYLPYPVSDVEINISTSGYGFTPYEITTPSGRIALLSSGGYGSETYNENTPGVQTVVLKDGRPYYYVVEHTVPTLYGETQIRFWGDDTAFFMLTADPTITDDELLLIFESMIRVDSRAS